MTVTQEITADHGSKIYVLQDFFSHDLMQSVDQYLMQAQWSDAEAWAYRRARFHCAPCGDLTRDLRDFLDSAPIAGRFSQLTGRDLRCGSMEFWKDLPRFCMGPHYDAMTDQAWWGCQIYLGSADIPLGTVFYADSLEILAGLPYQHNTGYFADRTDRILHGVPTVPAGIFRYSIYIKYRIVDQR